MDYQRDQFLRLIEAVEDQGGTHLDETCSMTTYDEWVGKKKKVKDYHYPGCGSNTLFEVPIEDDEPIRVCAVEDGVGLWPRFKDQVFD